MCGWCKGKTELAIMDFFIHIRDAAVKVSSPTHPHTHAPPFHLPLPSKSAMLRSRCIHAHTHPHPILPLSITIRHLSSLHVRAVVVVLLWTVGAFTVRLLMTSRIMIMAPLTMLTPTPFPKANRATQLEPMQYELLVGKVELLRDALPADLRASVHLPF